MEKSCGLVGESNLLSSAIRRFDLFNPRTIKKVIAAVLAATLMLSAIRVKAADADITPPDDVKAVCEKYGELYDIPPELLEAICYNESRYIKDVRNGSCKGIMQINVPVHRERIAKLQVVDIYDMDSNIHVGADLLAELFEMYGDIRIVIGAYHGESDCVSRAKNNDLSDYTNKILELLDNLTS